jgi:hypothetical protein
MCTVTWWRAPEGVAYEVFFNRDERRTRGAAAPPFRDTCRGVNYLAPFDSDHGGTWLLVNTRGVTLALVNHYPADAVAPTPPMLSRGLLLRDLADAASADAAGRSLADNPPRRCQAFYLLAFGLGELPRRWRWDTRTWSEENVSPELPFFTSSSFCGEEIARHRQDLFANAWRDRGPLAPPDLMQFHVHREPARPAWGILMDRPDARTVSVSRVAVGPEPQAEFFYQPRPPADGAEPKPAITAQLNLDERPAGRS